MALTPALARRAERAAKLKLSRIVKDARADIALVRRRKRDIEDAFYDIGQALCRLKAKEVVLALGRRSFAELCDKDLEISATQAERLIAIVRGMSRDEAGNLGASKAAALIELVDATPAKDTPAGALARGVALPDGKRFKPNGASTRAIERATMQVRQATPRKNARGRHVDADERELGEKLANRLHALGAREAKVTVVAGQPGKGARVRIEGIELAKLAVLGKAIGAIVHRRR